MNYNSRNERDNWLNNQRDQHNRSRENDRYRDNYQRPQNQFNHQDHWGPEWDRQERNQQSFNQNRQNFNRPYSEREDWSRGNRYGSNTDWQPQNRPRQSDYGRSLEQPRSNYHPERENAGYRSHNPDNRFESGNEWARSNREHYQAESDRRYTNEYRSSLPVHQPHKPRKHGMGRVGSVGGSFTSYSASRSRTGAMGHGSSGGILHRDGPGMNSYARGDINANSNW